MKICKNCKEEKELVKGRLLCKDCFKIEKKEINKKYNDSHRDEKNAHCRVYYNENKEIESLRKKEFYKKNTQKINERTKEYKENNKEKIKKQRKIYYLNNKNKLNKQERERRQNDLIFRIRKNISSSIRGHINNNYGIKKNSCLNYLSYTIKELKKYLEDKFEPWMSWDNYGIYYYDTWDDNDPSTWTWQIDHIIPQSDLPYTSMEDENFKKCWSLDNLRPLSAKQNITDGSTKVRHKKVV